MKEKPILFSGQMVRAILEGRKTQTRRVIKKPEPWQIEFNGEGHFAEDIYGERYNVLDVCPYGQPGDRLWVRETFGISGYKRYEYRAFPADGSDFRCVTRWKPSIHMPRVACRLILEVTDIRVERLASITDEDALAEGVEPSFVESGKCVTAYCEFARLWNSINGKPRKDGTDISWSANPWVWVVEFRRVEP